MTDATTMALPVEDVAVHVLVEDEPAQKHRNHGIDVGVRRNLRCGHMRQQPDVGGVADPRAADDQIATGADAARSPDHVGEIAVSHAHREVRDACKDDLPGGALKTIHFAGLPALGEDTDRGPS